MFMAKPETHLRIYHLVITIVPNRIEHSQYVKRYETLENDKCDYIHSFDLNAS